MKKALALIAAAALMATAGTAMAKSIEQSKHNVSNIAPAGTPTRTVKAGVGGTQICIYCHTPHNSSVNGGPIWNRNQGNFTPDVYRLYSGVGMSNISNKTGFTSDSMSLFCMSCHDGSAMGGNMLVNTPTALPTNESAALAAFTGGIGTNSKANLTRTNATGGSTDANAGATLLKTTHPVNFAMTVGGGDLAPLSASPVNGAFEILGLKGTGKKFPLYKSARSAQNSFECSSCHSVHDDENNPFLRDTNQGSQLCLGCHNK